MDVEFYFRKIHMGGEVELSSEQQHPITIRWITSRQIRRILPWCRMVFSTTVTGITIQVWVIRWEICTWMEREVSERKKTLIRSSKIVSSQRSSVWGKPNLRSKTPDPNHQLCTLRRAFTRFASEMWKNKWCTFSMREKEEEASTNILTSRKVLEKGLKVCGNKTGAREQIRIIKGQKVPFLCLQQTSSRRCIISEVILTRILTIIWEEQ